MKNQMTFLAVSLAALALGACASRGRQIVYDGDELAPRSGDSSVSYQTETTTYVEDGVSSGSEVRSSEVTTTSTSRTTRVDISRRGEYQTDLGNRLDRVSREIDSLRDAAVPGSECERRMSYLQALRDSLKTKLSELPNVAEDQYETRYLDLEDRFSVIQRFLDNDRAACTANR